MNHFYAAPGHHLLAQRIPAVDNGLPEQVRVL
jgi:hypothetical protein